MIKVLRVLKENINLISFAIGIGLIALGRREEGSLILQQGGAL